jgi:hypothetical protein
MLRQGPEDLVQGLEPLVQCTVHLCQCAVHLCQCAVHLRHCALHLRHWPLHLRHWPLHLAPWPKRLAPRPEGLAPWLLGTVHGPEDLLPWKEDDVPWREDKLRWSLRSSPGQFPELQRAEDLVPGSETAREGRLLAVPAQLPKHLADLPGCLGLSQGAGGERRDDDGACLERSPRAAGFSAGPVARGAAYFSASTALGTSLSRWLVFFVTPSRWDRVPASS